jgi:tetratricopeptide (TPR) repeat protein
MARSAAEAGDLRRALDLYDAALEADPSDDAAARERREVRERLAAELLTAGERDLMTDGREGAARSLVELCLRRQRWGEPLQGAARLRFEALRDGVQDRELARLDALAREGRSLDAAKVGRNDGYACGDLAPLRQTLADRVAALGAARCAELEAAAKAHGPYSQSIVERACVALGAHPSVHVTLPHQIAGVRLDGAVRGASDALLEALRQRVAKVATQTPLFDAAAPGVVEIAVAGYVRHAVRRTPTTLSHAWTESVPYADTETYQESYQEPYTDTEYYSERVPYTTSTYANGRSVPRTEYRTETRSRTVTKYRTAWRTRTRPVTRYRDEPRVFTHPAVHVEGTYEAAFTAEVHAPLLRTFPIPVAHTESDDAYEHAASFGPANVRPSPGNVPSLDDHFHDDVELVARRFVSEWRAAFTAVACKGAGFPTPEAGARCAWLGAAEAPDQAFLALQPLFGADVPALAELPGP